MTDHTIGEWAATGHRLGVWQVTASVTGPPPEPETTSTGTLTDFLLARVAEDEAVARAATPGTWSVDPLYEDSDEGLNTAYGVGPFVGDIESDSPRSDAEFVARHDPARALAECEAKRRIVEFWESAGRQDARAADLHMGRDWMDEQPTLTAVLRALALPYADHADYRAEWAIAPA